jgi:tetratricopeptide (TPR) repeat protein
MSLYKTVFDADNHNTKALNAMGVVLDKIGQYTKAIDMFEKAIRYSDNPLIPLVN